MSVPRQLPPLPDRVAAFGPVDGGPLPFTVDGVRYVLEVPYDGRLLAGWATAGAWTALVPGCIHPDDEAEFYDRLGNPHDQLGLRACHHIALGLSEEIYGVPWWAASRLCATVQESWRYFGAWAVANQFDPSTACAHRLISAALAWLGSRVQDQKEARRLEDQIFMPPKPQAKRRMKAVPGFTPEEQNAAFKAAFAALGSGE